MSPEFDPASVQPMSLSAFAAAPPEGVREWMQRMVDEGKGNNGGELEQWYETAFPTHLNHARDLIIDDAVWDLMMSPWRKKVAETVASQLKDTPYEADADAWVEKVFKKARAKTKRHAAKAQWDAGYIAGYAGDEARNMPYKVRDYAEAEARSKAQRGGKDAERKARRARDAEIAAQHGITDNTPIRKVASATLDRISQVSQPSTSYGSDYDPFVTTISGSGDSAVSLTTADVRVGASVWLRSPQGSKTYRTPAEVDTVKPLGVYDGEVFYQVTTRKPSDENAARMHENYGYYLQDKNEGFSMG